MLVCDKCHKNPVTLTLKFKTKEFDLCNECASKIVSWLEKPSLREGFSELWKKSKNMGGGI
jgi:protein-arginine kinase activator protein McsA